MEVKEFEKAMRKFIKTNRGNQGMKLGLEEFRNLINKIIDLEIKRADKEMMREYDKEMARRGIGWQFLSKEEFLNGGGK